MLTSLMVTLLGDLRWQALGRDLAVESNRESTTLEI